MNWYVDVLKNYTGFSGRARRTEFWMFVLFNIIISIVLLVIGLVLKFPFLGLIYSLAILLPSLAVSVRRLHDTGKSGWWLFISLVPFVGGIILIIFNATEGTRGDNQYGPDPKGAVSAAYGSPVA